MAADGNPDVQLRLAPADTNGVGSKSVEALGLPGVSDNAFPLFGPAGFCVVRSATAQERDQFPIENLQFVDTFSKIIGKHALRFGIHRSFSRRKKPPRQR